MGNGAIAGLISKGRPPGIGDAIGAFARLDSKTRGSLISSGMSAGKTIASDKNMRKGVVSLTSKEGPDLKAFANSDPENFKSVVNQGLNAAEALDKANK